MNKIKSFFVGILLLVIMFIMVVLTALIYRANERSSIKSYIFQMNNKATERVGELQDINNISYIDLRNRLIKKYVSEYFKVIPGDTDVTNRPVLRTLSASSSPVFNQWLKNEAPVITQMSAKNMFRMVRVDDNGIAVWDNTKNVNYKTSDAAEYVYYEVRYTMYTWPESNVMKIQPFEDHGTIYIEARFKPGLKEDINVREYLKNNKDPIGLFMFEVTNVENKAIK